MNLVFFLKKLKLLQEKSKIFPNEPIYNLWTNFINDSKYKQYFISNEENLINNEKSSKYNKNKNIKLNNN